MRTREEIEEKIVECGYQGSHTGSLIGFGVLNIELLLDIRELLEVIRDATQQTANRI